MPYQVNQNDASDPKYDIRVRGTAMIPRLNQMAPLRTKLTLTAIEQILESLYRRPVRIEVKYIDRAGKEWELTYANFRKIILSDVPPPKPDNGGGEEGGLENKEPGTPAGPPNVDDLPPLNDDEDPDKLGQDGKPAPINPPGVVIPPENNNGAVVNSENDGTEIDGAGSPNPDANPEDPNPKKDEEKEQDVGGTDLNADGSDKQTAGGDDGNTVNNDGGADDIDKDKPEDTNKGPDDDKGPNDGKPADNIGTQNRPPYNNNRGNNGNRQGGHK